MQVIQICNKSSPAAGCTDQWYIYIPMSGVLTSTISHHQLQDALINGIYIPMSGVSTSTISHHQLQLH